MAPICLCGSWFAVVVDSLQHFLPTKRRSQSAEVSRCSSLVTWVGPIFVFCEIPNHYCNYTKHTILAINENREKVVDSCSAATTLFTEKSISPGKASLKQQTAKPEQITFLFGWINLEKTYYSSYACRAKPCLTLCVRFAISVNYTICTYCWVPLGLGIIIVLAAFTTYIRTDKLSDWMYWIYVMARRVVLGFWY